MRSRTFIAILLASIAQAKEPKAHQTGTLLQMDSAECGVDERQERCRGTGRYRLGSQENSRPAVSGIPPAER